MCSLVDCIDLLEWSSHYKNHSVLFLTWSVVHIQHQLENQKFQSRRRWTSGIKYIFFLVSAWYIPAPPLLKHTHTLPLCFWQSTSCDTHTPFWLLHITWSLSFHHLIHLYLFFCSFTPVAPQPWEMCACVCDFRDALKESGRNLLISGRVSPPVAGGGELFWMELHVWDQQTALKYFCF